MRFEIILEIQKHIFSIPLSCSIRRKITPVEFHHFDKIKHTFCRDREAIFSSCLEEEEKIRNQKLLFTRFYLLLETFRLSHNPRQEGTRYQVYEGQ